MTANISTSNTSSVETKLTKVYFEMVFKSAFDIKPIDNANFTNMTLFSNLYLHNLADQFSESHNLGFGRLQFNEPVATGES